MLSSSGEIKYLISTIFKITIHKEALFSPGNVRAKPMKYVSRVYKICHTSKEYYNLLNAEATDTVLLYKSMWGHAVLDNTSRNCVTQTRLHCRIRLSVVTLIIIITIMFMTV